MYTLRPQLQTNERYTDVIKDQGSKTEWSLQNVLDHARKIASTPTQSLVVDTRKTEPWLPRELENGRKHEKRQKRNETWRKEKQKCPKYA